MGIPTCSTIECRFREWTSTHAEHGRIAVGSLEAFQQTLKHLAQRDAAGLQGHGLSNFAAMSRSEFAALNSYKPLNRSTAQNFNRTIMAQPLSSMLEAGAAQSELPSSFDWRDVGGVISSIKNQGTCGGCWAFSAVQGVESAWAKAGHGLAELSVQQVLDCDTRRHTYGHIACQNNGCNGGNTICAGHYISSAGLESNAEYPFKEKTTGSSCAYERSKAVASGIQAIQLEQTEEAIASGLQTGPVSVSVDATTWQYYLSGVYTGCSLSSTGVNHAVQIVGYGTDEAAGDYWTIRNSWGESWGEHGYIRIPRNVNCHGLLSEPPTVFWAAGDGPIKPTDAPKSSPFDIPDTITKCEGWVWTWDWDGKECIGGFGMSTKLAILLGSLLVLLLLCCLCSCCGRGRTVYRRRKQVVVYQTPQPSDGTAYVQMDNQYRV